MLFHAELSNGLINGPTTIVSGHTVHEYVPTDCLRSFVLSTQVHQDNIVQCGFICVQVYSRHKIDVSILFAIGVIHDIVQTEAAACVCHRILLSNRRIYNTCTA